MKFDRFIIAADNHGDMGNKKAIETLLKFNDIWKPSIRIHAGDNWDFRPLRAAAGDEEKREAMNSDFEAGMLFIERFRPTHFCRGNHCERIYSLRDKPNRSGPLRDHAGNLIAQFEKLAFKFGTKILPYDKRKGVLEIGKLRVVHGYAHGITAARRMAQVYGSVIFGHIHSIQSHSIEGIDNRIGRAIGCLCELDMDYNSTQLASLVHRHGFGYGVIHRKSGLYQFWQAEEIGGIWHFPSDITIL